MTVAIGLVCEDGVLVASDSMASDPATAHSTTKVFKFSCCPTVWTASGSIYVIEEAAHALKNVDQMSGPDAAPPAVFTKPDLDGLRRTLKATIHKSMRASYESALASTQLPAGAIARGFATDFLVAGYSNDVPWLLEFAPDGQINWHTQLGFASTGSGGPFATVARGLMAHYLAKPLTLERSKMVAYRAIETTCEVSPGGVGLPVQIAVVNADGATILTPEEVNEVGDLVARWKTLELETLLMGAEDAKAAAIGDLPDIGAEPGADAMAVFAEDQAD